VTGQPLLILGTRTYALELLDVASDAGFAVAGFIENMDRDRCLEPLEGLSVHWIDEVVSLAATHLAVCSLATTQRARFVEQVSVLGFRFATVVHPSAQIPATTRIGEGCIIAAGVIIGAHSELGAQVRVNRGALIGHHTSIGDFVTIQPGANIAGACEIGSGSYLGMGSIVIDHLRVGEGSVVGAGAVVTKDVPSNVQVVGIPARVVKENVEGK
jgi:sugar O-acyltransferase (sialic acid O-acetyltransferase NeuD family)